jgi:hypothetical protein
VKAGSDRFSTRGQPQRTHTTRPTHLGGPRLASLELTPQSMKKWRDVNDAHPIFYPVLLKLSRQLDPFERHAIAVYEGHSFTLAEHDPTYLLMGQTTLESVRQQIPELTERINRAVRNAKPLRAAANEEDSRLLDLLKEINDELSGDGS